jgi:hypothetical protein
VATDVDGDADIVDGDFIAVVYFSLRAGVE